MSKIITFTTPCISISVRSRNCCTEATEEYLLLPSKKIPPTKKQHKKREARDRRSFPLVYSLCVLPSKRQTMSMCPICYKRFYKSGNTSARNKLAQHATSTGHYGPKKHTMGEGAEECRACHRVFYDGGIHSAADKLEDHQDSTGHCRRSRDR